MSTAYFDLSSGDFSQDWSNIDLIATSNNWDGVPSIVGYRGDGLVSGTGVDPRTVTGSSAVINVNSNQTNPSTFTTGGVTEFHLPDPTVALTGSGTAGAPHLVIHLNATGRENVTLSFKARDIDAGSADAVQPIAVQYRIGDSGPWLNVDGGYIADASSGASSAMLVTPLTVTLPAEAADNAALQVRIITTDAVGSDDYIGIDDIKVTSIEKTTQEPGVISVSDASVVEGDSGVAELVFTVTRAGGSASTDTVDYAVDLDGTADPDDLDASAVLAGTVTFGKGESSKQIRVAIAGDELGEANETLNVTLSNVTGNASIDRSRAEGVIRNDDPVELAIHQIQGAGHISAYAGQPVSTGGIVTAIDSNGFYLQDATGDGDDATSDAVFVFTSTAPAVAVGDAVSVSGTVTEFRSGTRGLTFTEITAPAYTVESSGNALPAAVLIGAGGRTPPTATVDDDGLTSFDPATDGIDFYESLEGMRVTVDAPLVVSNTTGFGETYVVPSGGQGATGVNDRGGITISPGDFNPERLQIDADSAIFAGYEPGHSVGDRLASVTGVINYFSSSSTNPDVNNYELLVTEAVTVTQDVTLGREQAEFQGDANHLTLASMNVENLAGNDTAEKFDLLAENVVFNLRAPDVIAVQEVQDADGQGSGSNLSGADSAQGLIDAIVARGGPTYTYVEVTPSAPNSTGGAPNGNIRNGYLYRDDRVDLVEGSVQLIEAPAYTGTRRPLVAQFGFNGETITTINVHFTSRIGSDPLFGANQPPSNAGEAGRIAQAAAIKGYVNDLLAADPDLNVAVLGDFNGFYFEEEQLQLTDPARGGVFTNLAVALLPEEERYSYLFEGNNQLLDNVLVTGGLLQGARYDAVHINSQFTAGDRSSDHDPQVASFRFAAAPTDLALDGRSVAENLPAGTVVGTLSANDTPGDALTYALLDDADGRFIVDPETGVVTTTVALDYEEVAQFTIRAQVTDAAGETAEADFVIDVTDVDETSPAAAIDDAVAVDEDAASGDLADLLLGNDAGEGLAITAIDTTGTLGTVEFDAAAGTLRYLADDDAFDALATGGTRVDRFSYTVTDADGRTSTAAVDVTVVGVADSQRLAGGGKNDVLIAGAGEDWLTGGQGADELFGNGGHDLLQGGNAVDRLFGGDGRDVLYGDAGDDLLVGGVGDDVLFGGTGNDRMIGGEGADRFHFALKSNGVDTVADFDVAEDSIVLDGLSVRRATVGDVDGDGVRDLTIAFKQGGSAVLLGVDDFSDVELLASDYYTTAKPGVDFTNGLGEVIG